MDTHTVIAEPFEHGKMKVLVGEAKKLIGFFVQDVDGFYYFFPLAGESGHWADWFLTSLGRLLEEINTPWDNQISEELRPSCVGCGGSGTQDIFDGVLGRRVCVECVVCRGKGS